LDAFLAEGEGEMKDGPPKQWTEAEVRRLKTLIRQKVSAEDIAMALGRHVGSVRRKARDLGTILFKAAKAKS
jgi:IS30 family transposase